MGFYDAMHNLVAPFLRNRLPTLSPKKRYASARLLDAWEYGSGLDYRYEPPE